MIQSLTSRPWLWYAAAFGSYLLASVMNVNMDTLGDYMRTNGLVRVENEVIPCFETDGEGMDVYIACR